MIEARHPPKHAGPMIIAVLLAVLSPLPRGAGADQRVSVQVASGRTFTGYVDVRTDAERLWLRYGTGSITLIRPIRWNRIVRAVRNDERVSVEQLRQLAPALKSAAATDRFYDGADEASPSDARQPGDETAPGPIGSHPRKTVRGAAPPLRTVRFDVELANWDADVETDGLILHIHPLAGDGRIVPVSGLLQVDLTVIPGRRPHDGPVRRGHGAVQIARWTRPVRSDDARSGGITFRLPFAARHPEFDTELGSYGLVHVRLVVPGQGVFEDSQDAIRIRPFAPLRDRLQQSGQSRFLPAEQTGRS